MEIREMNQCDIQKVALLYIENWKETYQGILPDELLEDMTIENMIKKWTSFVKKDKYHIFVAYENEQFLGFGTCSPDEEINDCLYLDSLHVHPSSRGKGVGSAMIRYIGHYAYTNDYLKMSICIYSGNDYAGGLYQHMGAKSFKIFHENYNGKDIQSEKFIWDSLEALFSLHFHV